MKISYLFLIILLFGGCATKTLPPIKKYTIDENIKNITFHVKKCKSLKVEFPKSSDEIFSKNIIYQKGLEKNSYYFSKWYETPNEMLYKSILSILQNNRICKMVLSEDFSGNAEYILNMDILEFMQKFAFNKSDVQIKVLFYLKHKNYLIAQKLFSITVQCKSNNAIGAVKAFNEASKKLLIKFSVWLEKVLKKS